MAGYLTLKRLDDLEALFKLEYDITAEQTPDKKTLAQLYFLKKCGDRGKEYISSEQTEKYFKELFMPKQGTKKVYVSNSVEMLALLLALGLNTQNISAEKIFSQLEKEKRELLSCNIRIAKIVDVVEVGNFRVGFCCENCYERNIYVEIVSPNSYEYDFFEKGHFILRCGYYEEDFFLMFDPTKLSEDKTNLLGRISIERMRDEQLSEASRYSLTLEEFERLCRVKIEQEKKNETEARILREKLAEGGFSLGDIRFERDYISYQNQKIGVAGVPVATYINWWILKNEEIDFNSLFTNLVSEIFMEGHLRDEYLDKEIYVGSFPIVITKKELSNKTYYYIDGIKVSTKELMPAVSMALCFASVDEYHTFLNRIQDIPLRAHDLLVNGVRFKTRMSGAYVDIMFHVKREGKKYYLFIGDVCAHVKGGFNEILRLAEREYHSNYELYLSMVEVLCDKNKTIELIRLGIAEHAKAIERAKKLVDEVISKNKDKVKRITVKGRSGLWVKGQLREYFIDSDANVWSYENGEVTRRICIVDKGIGRELCSFDRIITRVYWLLNDKYVVDKVHTLR